MLTGAEGSGRVQASPWRDWRDRLERGRPSFAAALRLGQAWLSLQAARPYTVLALF